MRQLLFGLPLILMVFLGAVFYHSLQTSDDPFSSVLIDKPVPEFDLPAITANSAVELPPGLTTKDLHGDVTLVNVFASWCISCRVEHPLLMSISRQDKVPLMGLNWKDKPGDGAIWLTRFGNPYDRIGDDAKGRTAIDFGVTGAPETFIIDKKGRIRHKHTGPIMPQDWQYTLFPLIKTLRAEE